MKASVAVVGGGITGLTAAFTLLKQGVHVTIFEAQRHAGGLAATHDFGSFRWDRFYHCILTSDESLLTLINDLGLSSKLRWRKTEVGFYSRDVLHRMTSPGDLLKFPCMSIPAKMRFGLGILYATYVCDGRGLDSIPLKDWVLRIFGKTVYDEIWEPLLRCKLGELQSEASASFLWSTIRRLYSTREKSIEKKEQLGYVEGGYRVILDRLLDQILTLGGGLYLGARLDQVAASDDGIGLTVDGAFRDFDACLITIPAPGILASVRGLSSEYQARLTMPKYLGVVCAALVLNRPVSPYYLTNVTQRVPFTGIIEMTNLIDAKSTGGRTLVYLPKYTSPSDPLFNMSDSDVWRRFEPALFGIHPSLKHSDIESIHIFRERYVQPVPTLNYTAQAPTVNTGIPHLFVANTTQIVNDTLNNNAMTRIARKACSAVIEDLQAQAGARMTRVFIPPPTHSSEVRI